MENNTIKNDILNNKPLQNNSNDQSSVNQNSPTQPPQQPQTTNVQKETFVQPQIQQPNIYINTNNISSEEINGNNKSKKINGFFRIITLISLLLVGLLMLLNYFDIWTLSVSNFEIDAIYPFIVILSTIVLRAYRGIFSKIGGLILALIVIVGISGISIYQSFSPNTPSKFNTKYNIPGIYNQSGEIIHNLYTLNFDTLIGDYNIYGSYTNDVLKYDYNGDRELKLTNNGSREFVLSESKNINLINRLKSTLTGYLSNGDNHNIYLKSMIGNQNIDFSNTTWKNIKIHNGIGKVKLSLGKNIHTDNEIEILTFVGTKIILEIPKGLGVDIFHEHLMGTIELENMEKIGKNHYTSLNLDKTSKKLKINIRGLYTNLTINWLD